jgi:hypothetical protein
MKQALEAIEYYRSAEDYQPTPASEAITALRQAIAEAEKQEPVAWIVDGEIKVRLDMAGKLYYSETNVYAAPVHASDISQERVDETAKRKHEWVGLDGDIPGLGLVTEEFYNGMLCAEDILRRRNT